MNSNSWTSQNQCDEEVVKRVLAVAELLSKGLCTDPGDATGKNLPKGAIKTQVSKPNVSS